MKTMLFMFFLISVLAIQGNAPKSLEVELSQEAKTEIAHKAGPAIKQLFEEQGCKEADFFLGINPDTLDLEVFVKCTEVANAPPKAHL